MTKTVAILGASDNPERYAWRALALLKEHGYPVILISRNHSEIDGIAAYSGLSQINEPVDTVTVYLNPQNLAPCVDALIALNPRRVIFNPGSESPAAMSRLRSAGIDVEEACTLVLLRTGQF